MNLNLRPVLFALGRNPTGPILVMLQIAVTLAVLVNAVWIVHQRITKIERPTGIDTRNTFVLAVSGSSKQFNIPKAESEDLAYLRTLPGVAAATVTQGVPLTDNGGDTILWLQPEQKGRFVTAAELATDTQGLKTLGVSLLAGRNFRPDEIQSHTPGTPPAAASEIIVTRSLAHALFPQGHALGKTVYASTPQTIIGITHDFMGPQLGAPVYNTVIHPATPAQFGGYTLLVRTRAGKRDAVLRVAKEHIATAHRYGVLVFTQTLAAAKRIWAAGNRNVAVLLAVVTALMVAVCGLGIFGLTTFNVASRTRQIGTYRALGARKRDVVRLFLLENSLILSAGAMLGSILALMISDWLTARYALPRLHLLYLVTGLIVLAVIGEFAAWQPARRAARIPPSVATRTV